MPAFAPMSSSFSPSANPPIHSIVSGSLVNSDSTRQNVGPLGVKNVISRPWNSMVLTGARRSYSSRFIVAVRLAWSLGGGPVSSTFESSGATPPSPSASSAGATFFLVARTGIGPRGGNTARGRGGCGDYNRRVGIHRSPVATRDENVQPRKSEPPLPGADGALSPHARGGGALPRHPAAGHVSRFGPPAAGRSREAHDRAHRRAVDPRLRRRQGPAVRRARVQGRRRPGLRQHPGLLGRGLHPVLRPELRAVQQAAGRPLRRGDLHRRPRALPRGRSRVDRRRDLRLRRSLRVRERRLLPGAQAPADRRERPLHDPVAGMVGGAAAHGRGAPSAPRLGGVGAVPEGPASHRIPHRTGRGVMEPVRIFIGYDPREAVAFSVLAFSIHRRASVPVSIAPLMLSQLDGVLTRERHPLQSTDFAFSRFLTPLLSGYAGWSLFMDCDMLMLDDVAALWALRDERYAVQVVKHDHRPREGPKFLGQPQTRYEKKNWSSVMLFNNARCRALSAEYVNSATEIGRASWR